MSVQKCKTCGGEKTIIAYTGCHQEVVCPGCEGTGELRSHSCREFEEIFAHLLKPHCNPYNSSSVRLKKERNEWKFIYVPLHSDVFVFTVKFCPFCGEKLE